MSDKIARARESAAAEWLRFYCGRQEPGSMRFTADEMAKAFAGGWDDRRRIEILRGDDAALTSLALHNFGAGTGPFTPADGRRAANIVDLLWNELGEAREFLAETAEALKSIDVTYRARGGPDGIVFDLTERGRLNDQMAYRIERFLKGDADLISPTAPGDIDERTAIVREAPITIPDALPDYSDEITADQVAAMKGLADPDGTKTENRTPIYATAAGRQYASSRPRNQI